MILIRVGDSATSFSSGALEGNDAVFLAYQSIAGFAVIPWAKTLIRTVVLTTTAIVFRPGIPGASLSAMSKKTIDASPRGPNHPKKKTDSVWKRVFTIDIATGSSRIKVRQGPCSEYHPDNVQDSKFRLKQTIYWKYFSRMRIYNPLLISPL